MSTHFDTASRTLLLVLLALAGAGCLGGEDTGEAAEEVDVRPIVLPLPIAEAPCIPGLPPSYPGCWPGPFPGDPPAPIAAGIASRCRGGACR